MDSDFFFYYTWYLDWFNAEHMRETAARTRRV